MKEVLNPETGRTAAGADIDDKSIGQTKQTMNHSLCQDRPPPAPRLASRLSDRPVGDNLPDDGLQRQPPVCHKLAGCWRQKTVRGGSLRLDLNPAVEREQPQMNADGRRFECAERRESRLTHPVNE